MTLQPEHFDHFVSLSGDLFFLLSSNGNILEASATVAQELGLPLEELHQVNFSRFVHPQDSRLWENSRTSAPANSSFNEFALRLLIADKSFTLVRGRLAFQAENQCLVMVLRKPSSTEKELSQVLQKTLDQLNISLQTAQMGIWESYIPLDPKDHVLIVWDEEMHRMHGVPAGQTVNTLEWFFKHIHSEDLPILSEKTHSFIRNRDSAILQFNYRMCWPNGEIHYIDMYGSIDPSSPNEPLKMYGVAKDITEEVLKQKRLADQKNRIISSSRMAILGEISGGLAHEINNPLTVIQARSFQLAQMVEQNRLDGAKIKSAAESISKTGDKIAKIVKSLRAFAQNDEEMPIHNVSVKELLHETLDFYQVRFYNHGIQVRVQDIPDDLSFECHLIQIEEVLLNLLNNAYDAVLNLSEKWISLEAHERDSQVEIHVTDSGHGIPDEIADNIMLPFFTTKNIGRGMGLGLSFASDIMNKHKGQVFLDRSHNHTKFILRMPKKQKA